MFLAWPQFIIFIFGDPETGEGDELIIGLIHSSKANTT